MNDRATLPKQNPWPHRLAVALALVTLPLIGVGGLVTTYDAGMAVPAAPQLARIATGAPLRVLG